MSTKTRFEVLHHEGQFRLVTTEAIAAGEQLFWMEGELTKTPTRHSLQLDATTHLSAGEHDLETFQDRYFWRFMNHHCEPSVFLRGREAYAARALAPGDEITFHYNTTEYAMAEPFACQCGSARCQGEIRGFQGLARTEQEVLRPWLAPYLLQSLDAA